MNKPIFEEIIKQDIVRLPDNTFALVTTGYDMYEAGSEIYMCDEKGNILPYDEMKRRREFGWDFGYYEISEEEALEEHEKLISRLKEKGI